VKKCGALVRARMAGISGDAEPDFGMRRALVVDDGRE
jgi:hypothetical protein